MKKIVEILFQKNVQAWLEKKERKMLSGIYTLVLITDF